MIVLVSLVLFVLGMVLAAVGSRLAGRCATWCFALCGFPLWVVSGTVASLCIALPQLMLAFLASGLSITSLAVGAALAGAAADIGLVLAVCLLRRQIDVLRGEFIRKCLLLLAACLVLLLFVRDGLLSYTGVGLLMALFVLFVLENIVYQRRFIYGEGLEHDTLLSARAGSVPAGGLRGADDGTVRFPAMSIVNSLRNLGGVLLGGALLVAGAYALVIASVTFSNLTGTIQALWAATFLSLGFSLPLLAEAFQHPLGSVWKRFAERCRIYPPAAFPMHILNAAILNITLVLPIASLMYRKRLPVGEQFRSYELPACVLMALVLLVPAACKRRLYRWQGAACLGIYLVYLAAVLLAPRAGA